MKTIDEDMVHLIIRPVPGTNRFGAPPIVRLKGLLKVMLRQFGWRVIAWGPTPTDTADRSHLEDAT